MGPLPRWLGDLHQITGLGPALVGVICVVASAVCGAIIGAEREKREKPAGLRTLVLIAVGSTIFTLVSLLLAESKTVADPARLAAQIIPGIGFLGAGAILRSHGAVHGLTTAATIWAVAAVGVTIGTGHVAAGAVFTGFILIVLTVMQALERAINGRCRRARATVVYRAENGKALPLVRDVLDRYPVAVVGVVDVEAESGERSLRADVCVLHREHRQVLKSLAELPQVVSLRVAEARD